jgi:hypothetical protein
MQIENLQVMSNPAADLVADFLPTALPTPLVSLQDDFGIVANQST